MLIKAAVLHEYKSDFVIEDVELAEPGFNQVQIKIVSCGICHTDEMVRQGEGIQTPLPAVLGHEGAGIIEKVGPGVTDFEVGDHVVLSYPYCGTCKSCRSGYPNICDDCIPLSFFGKLVDGTTPLSQNGQEVSSFFGQASFATHAVAHINNVVKVDKDLDLRYLGILGCGMQTGAGTVINTFRPMPGDSIVIFGVGSVGLAALMAAKACGCTTIIAVDIKKSRLDKAMELGATHVINSNEIKDVPAAVKEIVPGGTNFAFDTTGVPECIMNCLYSLASMGTGCSVAVAGPVNVDNWFGAFTGKKWTNGIQGDAVPQIFIPQMLRLYKAGLFPFDKIVTFFDFEKINEAFEANLNGSAIKSVLLMP